MIDRVHDDYEREGVTDSKNEDLRIQWLHMETWKLHLAPCGGLDLAPCSVSF